MSDDFDDLIAPDEGKAKGRTPPYIAYKTLLNLLHEFKTNGLPPQIDRSVLTRFAGGLQGQIMLALRSLNLMDEAKKPTPQLSVLVGAYDTPAFRDTLRPIIQATYPAVLKLDLMTATPSMFAEAFKASSDAKEDVLRKCRTFFLHAARDVGIPIGPRIEKAKFPRRASNGTPRKPKAAKGKETLAADGNGDDGNKVRQQPDAVLAQLLTKFPDFDPAWPDDIKAKWFAGFDQFMKGATNNGG